MPILLLRLHTAGVAGGALFFQLQLQTRLRFLAVAPWRARNTLTLFAAALIDMEALESPVWRKEVFVRISNCEAARERVLGCVVDLHGT